MFLNFVSITNKQSKRELKMDSLTTDINESESGAVYSVIDGVVYYYVYADYDIDY